MKKKLFHFLTYRYHKGLASEQEAQLFDRWYQDLDHRSQQLPDDLQEREQRSLGAIFHTLDQVAVRPVMFGKQWRRIVAAAVMICFAIGIGLMVPLFDRSPIDATPRPAYRVIETGVGERKAVRLPDGSNIVLHARSSLRLDEKRYGKTSRTVELLRGEAFFDVEKDSSRAFIVRTGPLQTKVLGTSFGIQAYPEMSEQVISVYSGRVQVQHGEHTLGILRRGEQIRFDKNTVNSALIKFDSATAHSWLSGRILLQQASFEEVALAIKNNYGVTLRPASKEIAHQQYSLPIEEHVPFADVLQVICDMHRNRSRKEGDIVLIY
ncbi:FecR family protein [Sphingobacterium griseoflavum]|uniref:Iron dicitrate transporter FecR n=1 Tax=Sphingobacterium griseoflavum TaxID=1474952 RepID=A0ABQ3HT75_9SPHI|nr:FecR domain-containing protein [Sphingobacterium griseoflavum]GHE23377.1 iron dicitrate transporter FecR [Sphingobacterium griseoflavum]